MSLVLIAAMPLLTLLIVGLLLLGSSFLKGVAPAAVVAALAVGVFVGWLSWIQALEVEGSDPPGATLVELVRR